MLRTFYSLLIVVLLVAVFPAAPAVAQTPVLPIVIEDWTPRGAEYRIQVPENWNGDLIIFAHGYVSPREDVGLAAIQDQLILGDTSIPDLINGLGFAFAVTSYSANGLAVKEGIQDLLDLVDIFKGVYTQITGGAAYPGRIFLMGASEGALITTLSVEAAGNPYTGAMAVCGPTGDFRKQVNHWGDFRVVFDYFFPGVLPPKAVAIPEEVMANWDTVYVPKIVMAISASPLKTAQLLSVTKAAYNPFDQSTIGETVLGILWYNAFATNDGKKKLGGQPFDNSKTWYSGSLNDIRLNRGVKRYTASSAALLEIKRSYQTSGKLLKPLVNMHTTGDPIVPYWHASLYTKKVAAAGKGSLYTHVPVLAYGHCSFTVPQLLFGFAVLQYKTGALDLTAYQQMLETPVEEAEFEGLLQEYDLGE
jgi:acetyl esterase/lipase